MNIKKGLTRLFWVSFVICNIIGLLFGIREANLQAYAFNPSITYHIEYYSLEYYSLILFVLLVYDIYFLIFSGLSVFLYKTIKYIIEGFKG